MISKKLTSLKNIIAIPAVTIAIPIRDITHDFANSVDKSKLGRYGLLTLVNKFGASGYCKSKVHNEVPRGKRMYSSSFAYKEVRTFPFNSELSISQRVLASVKNSLNDKK